MTKYPLAYHSSSKGSVNIEDMSSPHLANAWRKLGGAAVEPDENLKLRLCMWDELVSRGCTYDYDTDLWTFPQKPEPEGA